MASPEELARSRNGRPLFSEVMKRHITLGVMLALGAFGVCSASAGQQPVGVAGVEVVVKQKPGARAITDARGNFALSGLAPGSYTIGFKAKKAGDVKTNTTDKVTVATTYAIKIDGTKRSVIKSGLTSDNLIAGLELKVDVAGAQVRGQVTAGAVKNMVWIPKEPGSNIPGRWVEANSPEAKAAFHSQSFGMSGQGLQRWKDNNADEHQEGFGNQNAIPGGPGGR
jgi:phosphate-selective porin